MTAEHKTNRLHSIRRNGNGVIATYRDDARAHREITVEEAQSDFLGMCSRTIDRLEKELLEWQKARTAALNLKHSDFQPWPYKPA